MWRSARSPASSCIDGGHQAKVDFNVDRSLPLFDGTTASIRYLNLIGDRYLELKRGDSDKRLPAGGTIPDRTHRAGAGP